MTEAINIRKTITAIEDWRAKNLDAPKDIRAQSERCVLALRGLMLNEGNTPGLVAAAGADVAQLGSMILAWRSDNQHCA